MVKQSREAELGSEVACVKKKRGRFGRMIEVDDRENEPRKLEFLDEPQALEPDDLLSLKMSNETDGDNVLTNRIKLVLVTEVVSGDTFEGLFLNQPYRVRMTFKLQGFIAASLKARDVETQLYAIGVKNRLTQFIGRKIVKVRFGPLEKQGRRLARVMAKTFVGKSVCVNDWMLSNNLGVSSYIKKHQFSSQWCSSMKSHVKAACAPLTVDFSNEYE